MDRERLAALAASELYPDLVLHRFAGRGYDADQSPQVRADWVLDPTTPSEDLGPLAGPKPANAPA